jgi:hypothetical protein
MNVPSPDHLLPLPNPRSTSILNDVSTVVCNWLSKHSIAGALNSPQSLVPIKVFDLGSKN